MEDREAYRLGQSTLGQTAGGLVHGPVVLLACAIAVDIVLACRTTARLGGCGLHAPSTGHTHTDGTWLGGGLTHDRGGAGSLGKQNTVGGTGEEYE